MRQDHTGTATAVPVAPRTRARTTRGLWWSVEVAPGSYARVVAWTSRDAQRAAVERAATAMPWRSPRRASFLAVVLELVAVADPHTGRDVTISASTLATRTGVSVRTVFRRLADARSAGLLVDVARGRHTTRNERERAQTATGRTVRRFATVRVLTHPAGVVVTPTRSRSEPGTSSELTSPSARRARTNSPRRPRPAARAPRPIHVQREAARLAAAWPWLAPAGSAHIGAVAAVLEDHALAAREVVELVDNWHAVNRRPALGRAASQPLAWLIWALDQARAAGHTTSAERHARDATERANRASRRAVERAADSRRRVTADSAAAREARRAIRAVLATSTRPETRK